MPEKRWGTIASSIKGAIRRGDLYAGARIASEKELAVQWDVSPVTVHRALAELQREGWVVRKRKLGTVVADRSARPTAKIGLVFSNPSDLPQGAYAIGIEDSLGEDLRMTALSTDNNPVREAKCLNLAASECSAIICAPTGAPENTALLKKIAASMPLLFIDCAPDGIEADSVMTDNIGSMILGLQHLHSVGHSRIAYFMGFPHLISSVKDRYAGYLQFMKKEIGMPDPERWVRRFSNTMPTDQHFDRVEAVLAELLSEKDPVTAVVCQQDAMMAAVLDACIHLGISVPSELAILSFNDVPAKAQPLARTVHRLVQRPVELGHMAGRAVRLRLDTPDHPIQTIRLLTDFFPAIEHVPSEVVENFVAARMAKLGKSL